MPWPLPCDSCAQMKTNTNSNMHKDDLPLPLVRVCADISSLAAVPLAATRSGSHPREATRSWINCLWSFPPFYTLQQGRDYSAWGRVTKHGPAWKHLSWNEHFEWKTGSKTAPGQRLCAGRGRGMRYGKYQTTAAVPEASGGHRAVLWVGVGGCSLQPSTAAPRAWCPALAGAPG